MPFKSCSIGVYKINVSEWYKFVEIHLRFSQTQSINVYDKKVHNMVEKDYKLYGTKILNLKTQEIGLLICLWKNKYADKTVDFATCVDKTGKRYNIELDNIRGFEDDFEK